MPGRFRNPFSPPAKTIAGHNHTLAVRNADGMQGRLPEQASCLTKHATSRQLESPNLSWSLSCAYTVSGVLQMQPTRRKPPEHWSVCAMPLQFVLIILLAVGRIDEGSWTHAGTGQQGTQHAVQNKLRAGHTKWHVICRDSPLPKWASESDFLS